MLNKFKIVPSRFVWILVLCSLYSCGGGDNNKIANLSLVDSLNAPEVEDNTNKTPKMPKIRFCKILLGAAIN